MESGPKIIERLHLISVRCSRHDHDHPCPVCIEAQEKEEKARDEQIRKERREHPEPILSMCGVGKAMLGCSFESFQGAEKTKALLHECIERGDSILLIGNSGTGKSHLSIASLRELVINFKVNSQANACFITVPELLMEIRSTYNNDRYTEKEIVAKYANIPYLIMDDIGAEKDTPRSIEMLYIIIDRRNRELLPTIYTTNLSLPEIEQYLGPRIASRMAQSTVITLDLPDYRRKRNKLKVATHV
jgi:DNA replication protein DnaC